jgi:beta-glucanase (GH16 family)
MEFLSREFNVNNNSFPVNLVLQSRESAAAGYDAKATGTFIRANLPFDPTTDFHEYRIDYLPTKVVFYADGQVLGQMSGKAVPTTAGHLILQHWSNGNPLWSGGPPARDAVLTVRYVKAYFNSSDPRRRAESARRCVDAEAPGAVCAIPELTAENGTAAEWFFGDDHGNGSGTDQTGNGGSTNGSGRLSMLSTCYLHALIFMTVMMAMGL